MDGYAHACDGWERGSLIIKATEIGKKTKIAALSAHVLGEERNDIIVAGCDDFIGKPYRENEIFDVMAKHLDLKYIYYDEQIKCSENDKSIGEPLILTNLDDDFLAELSIAVNNTDAIKIAVLAKKIQPQYPSIASALHQCAENFDYESILTALNPDQNIKG